MSNLKMTKKRSQILRTRLSYYRKFYKSSNKKKFSISKRNDKNQSAQNDQTEESPVKIYNDSNYEESSIDLLKETNYLFPTPSMAYSTNSKDETVVKCEPKLQSFNNDKIMENSEFKQGLIIQKLGDNCVIDHFQNNKYSLFILIFFVMMIVLKYFVFDCMFNFVYENIGVSNPYDQIRAV
jgi:hypothetical protein